MLDDRQIAAIRLGFGLPPPPGAPATPAEVQALLAGPDPVLAQYPGPTLQQALDVTTAAVLTQRAARADPSREEERKIAAQAANAARETALRRTVARALDSPDGFRERLVQFWADHFTVRAKVPQARAMPSALVETAIRPHVNGRFADMLTAATLHPAMLMYLDQVSSIGPGSRVGQRQNRGLNENLARELIELHTLGVGAPYDQTDVRELAKLLTGLGVNQETGTVFRPNWAEPGPEVVLGKRYDGEGVAPILALLSDLAARPETAAHVARKLAVHFVADDPPADLVARLTAVWMDSGGDLLAVQGALAAHPLVRTPVFAKVRRPLDLLVAGLRALGIGGQTVMDLPPNAFRRSMLSLLVAAGQPWELPAGPDGWPEAAEAWISPQRLAGRIQWAMQAPSVLVRPLPEAADLARRALGPLAEGPVLWAVARAETRAEAVGLVLSSPAFNRR